ncbi:MAG: hypothetical protein F6J97_06375 [Leptolyngbya sp. SIO4C1]|nr:hypothetical protein [Leptolyngbya sp. SIO4C1]
MRRSRVALLIGLVLGLSSCGSAGKVGQCNRFAEVINQAQGFKQEFETEIDGFTQQASGAKSLSDIQSAAGQYIGAVDTVVNNIDGMVDSLEGLSLPDEQLDDYRNRYTVIISDSAEELQVASEAMQLVANAESEEDLGNVLDAFQQKANTAFTNLQDLSTQEAELVAQINTYCDAEDGEAVEDSGADE